MKARAFATCDCIAHALTRAQQLRAASARTSTPITARQWQRRVQLLGSAAAAAARGGGGGARLHGGWQSLILTQNNTFSCRSTCGLFFLI